MRKEFLLVSATPLIYACLTSGAQAQTTPPASTSASSKVLEEVVVTALKRGAESLLKAPVPVAVVDTAQLAEREQVRLQDYANQVPGFTVAPSAANQSTLSIRGINAGGQGGAPTVGVTLDDVPFASSAYQPELDPGDLERIEVLRGPQGALYGANSMGGLVRFVTVDPSTSGFSGQISSGVMGIKNGDGIGSNVRGSVNIPISGTLAVRASGFWRREPGYIDDVLSKQNGINESSAAGGRVAALWRPTDTVSVALSALSQTIRNDASNELVLSLGDLKTNAPKDGTRSTISVQNYSAVVNAEVGGVHVTSITGYNVLKNFSRTDFSFSFGPILALQFGVAPYATTQTPGNLKTFTEELRLGASFGKLDVQVAGFYSNGRNTGGLSILPIGPTTGQIPLPLAAFNTFASFTERTEYAAFADVTYHFTERFEVLVGGRASHVNQTTDPYFRYGSFNRPNPLLVAATDVSASPITYLVTPRFQVTPDIMVYARAASGYRQGGANTTPGAPPAYEPDKTYNYEVGLKGRFLDGKLTADLSLYHIDWKQIQLQLRTPLLLVFTGNGGSAKSEGVELSLMARPATGTTLSGWIDYDNAVLDKDFVNSPTYGKEGDRLPNAPRISGHVSLRQDFPLTADLTGFAEIDASYSGKRLGIFQATALRQAFPAYTQTNLRAGLNYKTWSANVYVNNLSDVRGQLNGGIGYANPSNFVLIRPRTIGASITAKF